MADSLGKETLIYGIGNAINKLIVVFVLPLMTRAFTTAEMGFIDLAGNIEMFGLILGTAGIDTALTFFYWDSPGDPDKQRAFMGTALKVQFITAVAVAGLLLLAEPVFSRWYFRAQIPGLYRLMALDLPLYIMTVLFGKLCRILKKPLLFNVVTLSTLVLYVSSLWITVRVLHMDTKAVYLSKIVSYALVTLSFGIYFRKQLAGPFSFPRLKQLLAYGLPLIPFLFGNWLITAINRFQLNTYAGTETVGLYSVALKIANVVSLAITSFSLAWGPYAMSVKNRVDAPVIYAQVFRLYLIVTTFLVLCVQAASPLLLRLLSTPAYAPVAPLVGLLSIGFVLQALYGITGVGLTVVRKTHWYSVGSYVAVAAAAGTGALMIPRWGYWGVAAASIVGYGLSNLFIIGLGNRFYPLRYGWRSTVTIGIAIVAFAVEHAAMFVWHSMVAAVLVPVAYVGIILLARLAPRSTLERLLRRGSSGRSPT